MIDAKLEYVWLIIGSTLRHQPALILPSLDFYGCYTRIERVSNRGSLSSRNVKLSRRLIAKLDQGSLETTYIFNTVFSLMLSHVYE